MNKHLTKAKIAKNDEFYTRSVDIINGLSDIKHLLSDKTILLPFNDADEKCSAFFDVLKIYYKDWNIKKIIALNYEKNYKLTYCNNVETLTNIKSGDCLHSSNVELYKKVDYVIGNPPFSILRKIKLFFWKNNVKFYIIAPFLSITNFGRFNSLAIGRPVNKFLVINDNKTSIANVNCNWFSNFNTNYKQKSLTLTKDFNNIAKNYSKEGYLFIDKVKNIPFNYNGVMLLPLTILTYDWKKLLTLQNVKVIRPVVNGRMKFQRLLFTLK